MVKMLSVISRPPRREAPHRSKAAAREHWVGVN